jgi:hypothetical protein
MSVRCPKCGAEVEDGWPVCRKCFEPVNRPGILTRLFSALFPRVNIRVSKSDPALPGATTRTVAVHTSKTFKVRDAKTGELQEYHSLDDVPEQFRELLRQQMGDALQLPLSANTTTRITWTDSAGTVHHCKSIDELPPAMRAVYETMMGRKDKT